MRNPIARALVLLLAVCLSSCGLIKFDVSQDLPKQTVPGSPLGGLLPSFVPVPIPLTIDLKAETAKQGTGPATGATLKSLVLTITPHNAPVGTFDFISEVHISIGPRDSGSTLPVKEIANMTNVPKGLTTLTFTILPDVELLPYINAGAQLTGTAKGTQPSKDVSYDGQVVVTVKI